MLVAWIALFSAQAPAGEAPIAAPPAVAPSVVDEARAPQERRALRVAVYEFERSGVDEVVGRVVMSGLLRELRKLDRVSVIGMDEVRAMLGHEAQKQATGCTQESCLSEIADAVGVDVLVIGSLTRVGEEHVFGLRRLNQLEARVTGSVARRFAAGGGEEFLGAIGPAVAELFPDAPLRPGMTRGVDVELAERIRPPPLAPWVFWSGVGASGIVAAAAIGAGVTSWVAYNDAEEYRLKASPFVLATWNEKADAVDRAGISFFVLGGSALVLAAATGVVALFTDFAGPLEDEP